MAFSLPHHGDRGLSHQARDMCGASRKSLIEMSESQEENDGVSLLGLMFMKLEICFFHSDAALGADKSMVKGFVEELDMCPLEFSRIHIHKNKCLLCLAF